MGFCFLLVLFSVLLFVSAFCLFCFFVACLFACSVLLLLLFCFFVVCLKVSRYKTWEIHSFILISDFACFVMLPIEIHSSFLVQALKRRALERSHL